MYKLLQTRDIAEGAKRTGILRSILGAIGAVVASWADILGFPDDRTKCGIAVEPS